MLEAVVREHLNVSAPRTMVVLDPLKVTILNLDKFQDVEIPDFPNEPEKGTHKINFSNTIYIERSDFKSALEKGYRRLAPGQVVGLRYAGYVINLVEAVMNNGEVGRCVVSIIYSGLCVSSVCLPWTSVSDPGKNITDPDPT